MLRKVSDLAGCAIHATDGDLGHIDEFYFDDESWTVRYLVVSTGNWLTGRKVLISPVAVLSADWEGRRVDVSLTRDQVRKSPDVETHRPVSRQWETQYHAYYDWPIYWAGSALTGVAVYPSVLAQLEPASQGANATGDAHGEASHLQSTSDVRGYDVAAADGEIGHVGDFVVDDATWAIRYLEIDSGTWWSGRHVLLAPKWIHDVRWAQAKVEVDLPRETIATSPEYNRAAPVTREYEELLHQHYGHARYWLEENGPNRAS